MKDMAKPKRRETLAEVPFIITVGVPEGAYLSECARALNVLRRAGFEAGATTHETFKTVAEDFDLLPQLREIRESGEQ